MARTITIAGTTIGVPEDATDEQIAAIIRARMAPEPEPDSFVDNALDVAGEFANAANRSFLGGADFVTSPLRVGYDRIRDAIVGEDRPTPSLERAFVENTPGGAGGFMEEGLARDAVQAAGSVVPAAVGGIPVAGRNVAGAPGALAELAGFGTGTPAAATAGQMVDLATSPAQVPMAARADAEGWPITPGERTGLKPLRDLEAMIDSTPMIRNPMHRIQLQRQQMLNDAAAESLGLPPGTALTDDVIGDTAANISGEFRALTDQPALQITDEFLDDMGTVAAESQKRIFREDSIPSVVDEVLGKIDEDAGVLSVPNYQDISSELKAKIRQAWKGENKDPYFARSLGDIVEALDELAINGMDPIAQQNLAVARQRWKALTDLENSRALRESGDVSGPLLANYLRRTDRQGYGRGGNTGPLYERARLSKAFPGSRGDSGTATRMYLQSLLTNPLKAVMALGTAPLATGLANAYMAGGRGLGAAYRGAQRYPGAPLRVGALFDEDE